MPPYTVRIVPQTWSKSNLTIRNPKGDKGVKINGSEPSVTAGKIINSQGTGDRAEFSISLDGTGPMGFTFEFELSGPGAEENPKKYGGLQVKRPYDEHDRRLGQPEALDLRGIGNNPAKFVTQWDAQKQIFTVYVKSL